MDKQVQKGAQILLQGGVVIFPTDTVYGVGALLTSQVGIEKLYRIKQRAHHKPTAVLISNTQMLSQVTSGYDKNVEKLMQAFWPGGLTLILKALEGISDVVTGGMGTIGVRMPGYKMTISLIEAVGVPIVAASANIRGKKAPVSFDALDPLFVKQVDFVIQADTAGAEASTVLDTTLEPMQIIRDGAVSRKQVSDYIDLEN